MAGGRALLDHGRILLRHLVHLAHRGVDLRQTAGLFGRTCRNIADDLVDLSHLLDDTQERLTSVPNQRDAKLDLLRGGRNQRLDLLGSTCTALRQGADFTCHDGKAATGISGSCRLNACIQCEQVGLERDLIDDGDDLADLARRGFNRVHRLDSVLHNDTAVIGVGLGGRNHAACLFRAFRRCTNGGGDFVQSCCCLLKASRLLFGAP